MENKIVNLNALDKVAKELRRKSLADINQQEEKIEEVRDMFGGKSFRYVLQEEYDNLSEEEKNDPSIVWSITDAEESVSKEYVDEEVAKINDMLQHMDEGIRAELDKKSNILNYSDHTLNGTETYNNLEKVFNEESSAVYTINKPINLTKGTICSIEVKFSDDTNLLSQGIVRSDVLAQAQTQKEINYIESSIDDELIILMDKVKYYINNANAAPEHNDNTSALMIVHPNANNVISLTITKPTTFEINNNFFTDYQFVNDTEKENWNNKADKSELFSGNYNDLSNKPVIPSIQGLATEVYVDNAMAELREEMVILEEDDLTIEGLVDESFPSLTTEDKTLIGAINEINSELIGAINEINSENEGLQNQINELFQNVSSGKELIASAITDKGVDASEEETFQSLSEKINQIPVGPPGSNIIGYINENNDIYVSLTELESGTYTLKFEDYTGLLNEFDDIGTVEV